MLGFSAAHHIQRLAQKHPWNANECNGDENGLNCRLAFEHKFFTTGQWNIFLKQQHVDEHVQNGRGASTTECEIGGCATVREPFEEHQEHHVGEKQHQKQNLWQKFEENAGRMTEVHHVDNAHANTENHVNHTEYD